jgi:hypothetical protein
MTLNVLACNIKRVMARNDVALGGGTISALARPRLRSGP